ncbi:PDR/VanB family oxidoreductase [Achromobacter spanius]|uniref:Ferredoxin n=1 Tax=Achromobacter spanius TaxID=217203 RepID=A0AAW3HY55_9BURK|nr:PDR/VanB family oxidoreductase [Achromobacter spanius]KNE25042.1 ferredoxin [Achromobacter spanius]
MFTPVPIPVRVQCMRVEARHILSLELAALDGEALPVFTPGAHIDLHLSPGIKRSYSLCSSPEQRDHYVVGVLHDRNSRGGSAYIHQQLRPGQQLLIDPPRNHFELDASAELSVLIAGGIGITPILCMLLHLLRQGKRVALFYAARSRAEAAFLARLPPGLQAHLHFDEDHGGAPDLHRFLAAMPDTAHFYCCGPRPMIDAFETAASLLNLPHCHVERFGAKDAAPAEGAAYQVTLAKSGKTLAIEAGAVLLDCLLRAGIEVPYSCREGVCGSCETRVLSGTPEHRDSVLSQSEQAANSCMMVCVSGCLSKELVLDL